MKKFYIQNQKGESVSLTSKNIIKGNDDIDIIKVREDLVEVFSDMDSWEKNRMRIDYFSMFRKRNHENQRQELLERMILEDYNGQVDILSEIFFEVLYIEDFQTFVIYINSYEKVNKFFDILESYELDDINNFHSALVKTFVYFNREIEVCKDEDVLSRVGVENECK